MHCLNSFRRLQISVVSKTLVDKPCIRTHFNRRSRKKGKDADRDAPVETQSKTKQRALPIALQHFTYENKDENSKLFEDNLETIRFDIENLKALKLKHQIMQKELREKSKEPYHAAKKVLIGTPDEQHMASTVPCGGCGAFLHCNNPSLPGYIPQQQFKGKKAEQLATLLCKRCTIMSSSNDIIKLDIDKTTYKQIIKKIKKERALIVMVIDVTDMANSIIPEFLHDIGTRRPIIIVGNKIDLIPKDYKGYLNGILSRLNQECRRAELNPCGTNIRHTCLVSAKTGYGIEELINKLIRHGHVFGDVYLVGTTNSGKSTLFNTFLASDYCKHTYRDIVQRATVSKWPGTTLDVIKFPIFSPSSERLHLRYMRLKVDQKRLHDLQARKKVKLKEHGRTEHGILIGHVGKTEFRSEEIIEEENKRYSSTGQSFSTYTFNAADEELKEETGFEKGNVLSLRKTVLEEKFPEARWTCDTPGLINENQLINKLEGEELKTILDMQMIRPRVFVMKPGDVMFVTGLARLDYLEGKPRTFVTVHTNHFLPVHVIQNCDADQFYSENVGTEVLGLPIGDSKRLDRLPSLSAREFHIEMEEPKMATTDLQLSSLGWLSFSAYDWNVSAVFRAYTPGGRGMQLRTPALLPNITAFKGPRIIGTKQYQIKRLRIG